MFEIQVKRSIDQVVQVSCCVIFFYVLYLVQLLVVTTFEHKAVMPCLSPTGHILPVTMCYLAPGKLCLLCKIKLFFIRLGICVFCTNTAHHKHVGNFYGLQVEKGSTTLAYSDIRLELFK